MVIKIFKIILNVFFYLSKITFNLICSDRTVLVGLTAYSMDQLYQETK